MSARTISKGRVIFEYCARTAGCIVSSLKTLLPQRRQQKAVSTQAEDISQPKLDPEKLNCRVQLRQGHQQDVLEIYICGKAQARQGSQIRLRINLYDITDGDRPARPVYNASQASPLTQGNIFEHVCELGKVPQQSIDIPRWMSIAKIETKRLMLARSGRRQILLKANLNYIENSEPVAQTRCIFDYETCQPGYLDIRENIERAKALGVTLAVAIISADGRMYKSEIECVRQWAYSNIHGLNEATKKNRQLERALNKTVKFFRRGRKVDVNRLCREVTEIAPTAYRYDIVALCLRAVEAKGFVAARQLNMLKKMAAWLEVDSDKFRQMLEKLAPATTHQVKDIELLFGLSEKMSSDQNLEQLNHQYRKWNARASSIDSDVQNQAEQMLDLIAKARSKYTS